MKMYRNHFPNFDSNSEIKKKLIDIKNKGHILGLITDGYSITQRNKLKALDIIDLFDLIVISEEFGTEKPNSKNFEIFHQFETDEYYYFGDNVSKDFIAPNTLGWTTVCLLDNEENIHKQEFDKEFIYLPKVKILNINDFQF
jgi:putative hydrolase of the HAD superfamily